MILKTRYIVAALAIAVGATLLTAAVIALALDSSLGAANIACTAVHHINHELTALISTQKARIGTGATGKFYSQHPGLLAAAQQSYQQLLAGLTVSSC